MNLRDELDRIAKETGWCDPDIMRSIRRALDKAVEACAQVLERSSGRFSQPEGADLLRAAIRKESSPAAGPTLKENS